MSRTKRLRLLALVAVFGTLAGCTAEQTAPDRTTEIRPATPTATVTERSITDTLAVPAEVRAGVAYAVTAPSAGALVRQGGGFAFRAANGVDSAFILPLTSTGAEPTVPFDVDVGQGTPLLRVADGALSLVAELSPSQVLRLAGRTPSQTRAQIEGSSGPFDCSLHDPRPSETDGSYALSCAVPTDVPSVVGATGTLAVQLDERLSVLALPIEAVAGSRDRGFVFRDSAPDEPVEVDLGISDGVYIEILSGLLIGDTVRIPSPSILDG